MPHTSQQRALLTHSWILCCDHQTTHPHKTLLNCRQLIDISEIWERETEQKGGISSSWKGHLFYHSNAYDRSRCCIAFDEIFDFHFSPILNVNAPLIQHSLPIRFTLIANNSYFYAFILLFSTHVYYRTHYLSQCLFILRVESITILQSTWCALCTHTLTADVQDSQIKLYHLHICGVYTHVNDARQSFPALFCHSD